IDPVQALRNNRQDFSAPRHFQLRTWLRFEKLAAEVDQVFVAVENIALSHRVRAARNSGVLDQNALCVSGTDRSADRYGEVSTASERGERVSGGVHRRG